MKQGFLRSSRYSPGNMSRESLEALFVGRSGLMEDVLSRVTTSIQGSAKHYVLLVGPRGSGKTHFLALAYHRLMDRLAMDNARDRVAVAMLKEEEWGVASFLDFVVRILGALADSLPEIDAEIKEIRDRFSKDPADAEAFAAARLRLHTRGKTLLLFCENLVDVFEGLGEDGQRRWRAAIQEDGNWTIVASTPSLFSAVTLQDSPFYGFFTICPLKKIDFEAGLDLLAKKAAHERDAELKEFLRTPLGRARVRAIHHLAAGNPRAYVVLFDFLDRELLEDLVHPFLEMVDELTPYYQGLMRQLPPAQRKIVEFLCHQGRPRTVKDIARPCLMSHQTAAKQIGELQRAGFVSKTCIGRNTYCELSEPLMRICIEVKDNKAEYFRLFVEFLRHWFTNRELEQRQAEFQHDHNADLDRLHVEEAVKRSSVNEDDPFLNDLREQAEQCRRDGDYRRLAEIQNELVEHGGGVDDYRERVSALRKAGDTDAAIAAGHEATARFRDDAGCQNSLAHALYDAGRFPEALATIDLAIGIEKDPSYYCFRANILLRLSRFGDAIQQAQAVLRMKHERRHSLVYLVIAMLDLGRPYDAEPYARELEELMPDEPNELFVDLCVVSRFHLSQGRLDKALELVDRALAIDAGHQYARELRGDIRWEKVRHYDQAQTAAATEPLADALDRLTLPDPEDFKINKERRIEAIARIVTTSVRNFGPRHLPQGLVKLRKLLKDQLEGDVVGAVLTCFLKANVGSGFAGSLVDWEWALSGIARSLAGLTDCRIPIEMLRVAVKYTKTGNERHLLGLPLEQRRLLENVLPSATGERADRSPPLRRQRPS